MKGDGRGEWTDFTFSLVLSNTSLSNMLTYDKKGIVPFCLFLNDKTFILQLFSIDMIFLRGLSHETNIFKTILCSKLCSKLGVVS